MRTSSAIRYTFEVILIRELQATDVYLTPYLNPVQIVSGALPRPGMARVAAVRDRAARVSIRAEHDVAHVAGDYGRLFVSLVEVHEFRFNGKEQTLPP